MIKQQITGTVYGVILNDSLSVQKIGSLEEAPYKGAPKARALYIKPANTRVACSSVTIEATAGPRTIKATAGPGVNLPDGETSVEVAATIGLVMGRAAGRLTVNNALDAVAGIVLAADLSLPHTSYYRPAIREKCFDGALPLSSVQPLSDVSKLVLKTEIDGQLVDTRSLAELIRTPAQLLAEVSEFMTLRQGDVLLVGIRYMAPQAKLGSQVTISAEGVGSLKFLIAAQGVQA